MNNELTLEVEGLEKLTEELKEAYRSELEKEIKDKLGENAYIGSLSHHEGDKIKNYSFKIGFENWDVGTIFPFRKIAFCQRGNLSTEADPVVKEIKAVLQRRGYEVRHSKNSFSPLYLIENHFKD